jgi:hypothetical protein
LAHTQKAVSSILTAATNLLRQVIKLKIAASMSKQEKKWRAESDAEALARAKEVQDDPKRLKAAQSAAKSLVAEETKYLMKYLEEKQDKLAGLKRLAKKANNYLS